MKIHTTDQIINFMDQISIYYDIICKPCSDDRIAFLKKIINQSEVNSPIFVDVSCSTGETINRLSKRCKANFYGIDISQGMIKKAIKNFR